MVKQNWTTALYMNLLRKSIKCSASHLNSANFLSRNNPINWPMSKVRPSAYSADGLCFLLQLSLHFQTADGKAALLVEGHGGGVLGVNPQLQTRAAERLR